MFTVSQPDKFCKATTALISNTGDKPPLWQRNLRVETNNSSYSHTMGDLVQDPPSPLALNSDSSQCEECAVGLTLLLVTPTASFS